MIKFPNAKAGTRPRRWLALMFALVATTGCGSDDEGEPLDREELISRGDAVCEADYAALADVTGRVTRALREVEFRIDLRQRSISERARPDQRLEATPTAETRDAVAGALDDFIDNLEGTSSELTALDTPADEQEALTGYLDSLKQQIEALSDARDAFVAGELNKYNRFGSEFNALGRTATRQAREYGFRTCSGSRFA